MSDIGDFWRDQRTEQQARRAARLGPRTSEVYEYAQRGHTLRELTPFSYRLDSERQGGIDLYPIHQRYHIIATGERGSYYFASGDLWLLPPDRVLRSKRK